MALETASSITVPLLSSAIADLLLVELCSKEITLSNEMFKQLFDKETFESVCNSNGKVIGGQFVPKYRLDFANIAYRITVSNYSYFPPFSIDERDLSTNLLEFTNLDEESQHNIIMDVVSRVLKSTSDRLRLLFYEHIRPNLKKCKWKWETFDFG
jgi:hypothetical protein